MNKYNSKLNKQVPNIKANIQKGNGDASKNKLNCKDLFTHLRDLRHSLSFFVAGTKDNIQALKH